MNIFQILVLRSLAAILRWCGPGDGRQKLIEEIEQVLIKGKE